MSAEETIPHPNQILVSLSLSFKRAGFPGLCPDAGRLQASFPPSHLSSRTIIAAPSESWRKILQN